nr:hypothetical protein [Tanacetum cinerariifolium]
MCKQSLISVNHDECLLNYVNDKNSRGKKQSANVSIKEKQKKREPKVKKPMKVESHKSLATPTPKKPRSSLRWSPTGRMFDINDTIIASSKSESQSDCSKGGDLKGKSKDTSSISDTRNPLPQKLENENIKLKFQLFKKVFDQKDNTLVTSSNTKFAKQPIVENLPTAGKTNALSNPVTSNSVSTPKESKRVNNDKVIAPGMFMINPSKTYKEEKQVPNTVSASARTKPITASQPPIITKKDVNSDLNGLSSTGIDNTKTKRPQPRSNTKNDRVPSASKSSRSKNKEAEVEEHHRNLLLSKNMKHMLSACNNFMLDSQNVYSKVVCAMCKQSLISVNHDECLLNYVNDKNSRGKKQSANVSIKEKQKKREPKVKKPKKVESHKSLATPTPRKPRSSLRWSPTGRMFDINDTIITFSKSESQSDCSKGDNACTSNPM